MGALRDRMIEEMKLRNFSAATQRTYLYGVTRLTKYHGKAPDPLSKEEIRAFLVHLLVERKLAPNGRTAYCLGSKNLNIPGQPCSSTWCIVSLSPGHGRMSLFNLFPRDRN